LSPRKIADIETSLSLIDASLSGAEAFLQGEPGLIDSAQDNLSQAVKSAYQLGDYELIWIVRTLSKVLKRMWADSPWVRLKGIITRRTYLRKLVEDGIVTLWSSQIAALEMRSRLGVLQGGYLDNRIKRVVIHMPTSAGKTLLAEFAIAHQSFSAVPKNKCVYIAPYRALCDQVATELANRLARFGIQVTTVVSDNDLTEYESILFKRASVIVVTPEKLGYLFRQRNQLVQEVGLFVFDELHNIGKSGRGWAYEELISLLLQHPQTSESKMIFLSAVMPNHVTVQEWVDAERLGDTVSELWQPTRLLKGAITFRFRRPRSQQKEVMLPGDLIYVRHKGDLNSPLRISHFIESRQVLKEKSKSDRRLIRDGQLSDDEIAHAVAAAERFARLGPVLVYSPTQEDTVRFCRLALNLDLSFLQWRDGEETRYREILEFIRDRFPTDYPLIKALEHRIAFHHAGLPRDVRSEIEYAFRKGWIHILAATTTLVEGVNLPVKTLLLADYCQRYGRKKVYPLSERDFRNIMGRAGRALYETEGQVVFIQSIAGYPYGSFDTDFEDYLSLEPDSPELNITSTLADDSILADLGRLVEEVDNGKLSEQQLLFEIHAMNEKADTVNVVNKLHAFSLLLQDRELVGEDEESYVRIFQGTFLGKQRPDDAPQIVGAFSHRGAKAIRSLIDETKRGLFAQTGLKIPTCHTLMERVHTYWDKHRTTLNDFLSRVLDYDTLYEIAKVIYDLEDDDVDPAALTPTPKSRKKQRLKDDRAFLVEWIISHNTEELLDRHLGFIQDPSWRAEQYVRYTQQTLGYRAPWTLSAFWLFLKAIAEKQGVDLVSTTLGRELVLLPAYAKFGVNTPAAALFSTLGVSPPLLARRLGELYEEQHSVARYDYQKMLDWLLSIEPVDMESRGKIQRLYIRRLIRILASLRPLEAMVSESERMWEAKFPIAGWQHYQGENILRKLRVGDALILKHEPANPYDPNAVEILTEGGIKVGYVPRYLAPDMVERINIRPIKATISEILSSAPADNKIRIHCVDRW
ncbi:DEAD/DEAH box helicase, partial [Candidatus Poribacteria bacterium]|nr:DEAD/DEAH box helicase [Candidatus Poribacteria bacterium]